MRRLSIPVLIISLIFLSFVYSHQENRAASVEGRYLNALKLVGRGQYEEALTALRGVVKTDPTFFKAFRKIIEVCRYKRDLGLAKAFFEQLRQEHKDDPGAYYGLGLYFADKEDFPQAVENSRKAIALFSRSPYFFQLFLNSSERLKQLEDAEAFLLKISKNEPENFAALYGLAYLRFKQRKWDEAIEHLENAIKLNPGEPFSYRLKCDLYQAMGRNKEILDLGLDKVKMVENLDPDLAIDFYTRVSSAYSVLGEYQKSYEYDQKTLNLAREIGNKRSEGIALGNMGVYYANVGNFPEAMKLFNQKLIIVRELSAKEEEVQVLSNIGAIHDWQGNVQKSLESYGQALKILEEMDDRSKKALLMGNMGAAYEKLSDYPKALDYYHQALKIFQDLKNKGNEAWILGNIGAVTSKLGNDSLALDYFQKALVLMQEVGDKKYEGWILGTMGAILKRTKDTEKSFQYLNKALEIAREIGDKRLEVDHLANIGSNYQEAGEYGKAAEYLEQGLKIAEQLGDKVSLTEVYIMLGILHRDVKNYDQSIGDFQKALTMGNELGVPRTIWNSEWGLALSYEKEEKYDLALKHYKNAINTVESIRGRLVTEEQKVGFLGETIKIYEGLIDLLLRLKEKEPTRGYVEESFHVAERAKSRAFLELLAEAKVNLASGISQELENEEKNLQIQLTGLQQKLLDPGMKSEEKENVYKELQTVEARYNTFVLELRKKSPEYASVAYPEPYTLAEARAQLLDEKTYIVEFFMGEENFFLWVISKDKVLWSQSFRCEQKFFEKIANFQSQIAQHKINLDFQLGKDIYDLLLKDALKQVPVASHLVIIPDGLLLRLPFEALVKDFDGRAPKYLLEYYPISYAPSASVLAEVKKYHRRGSGPSLDLLALGNPVIEDKGEANKATVENLRAGGVHLLPLPYAEDEVFSINQIYKKNGKTAEFYVKEKALEEVIKSRETSQSKTLHFATHGFIDDRVPALSGLLLAPSQDPRGDDGFLRLNEIFQLKLNADLVTLSACETALGKEVRGEGMIGLTRAFFYAGASSIMASLWMVSDQSTAILMKDFYSHYIRGERASTALRQAKLNMLKNNDQSYRHPFFWAPFIIMGSF